MNQKLKIHLRFLPFGITLPAICLGAVAMYHHGLPMGLWIQNVLFGLFCSVVLCFLPPLGNKRRFHPLCWILALFLFLLPLLSRGVEEVHRWVFLGPLSIQIAFILLPILFWPLCTLLTTTQGFRAHLLVLLIALLLYRQPDASQLTSFAVPIFYLTVRTPKKRTLIDLFTALLLLVGVLHAWLMIDSLPPVLFVENILTLVSQLGNGFFVLGVLSLLLLPFPFLLFPPKKHALASHCIGLYYLMVLISTWLGDFPVPFMGYGLSPLLGYYLSLFWYIQQKHSDQTAFSSSI